MVAVYEGFGLFIAVCRDGAPLLLAGEGLGCLLGYGSREEALACNFGGTGPHGAGVIDQRLYETRHDSSARGLLPFLKLEPLSFHKTEDGSGWMTSERESLPNFVLFRNGVSVSFHD